MSAFAGVPRVLVTRPAHDAKPWLDELRQAGVQAEAFPLIEIAGLKDAADVAALHARWRDLSSFSALMFVSGNAVSHFFEGNKAVEQWPSARLAINKVANDGRWIVPEALRFMAPGPGTAAALIKAGVPAGQIDAPANDAAQFDSEALWDAIGKRNWRGCRVLMVRGRSAAGDGGSMGRDWLIRQWEAAGAQVNVVPVYQRLAPQLPAEGIALAKSAAADGTVWLFSSSEAIANLLAQPSLSAADWRRARALVTHPRIADAARAAGWGVVVESRPALPDVLATLRSIESGDS